MMTRVYRVARVLAGSSPVTRIDAIDAAGHDLRLELPKGEALGAAVGRVIVLQWSLHDLPAAPETPQAEGPTTITTTTAPTPETTGQSVDEDFMALMARGRPAAAPEPERATTTSGQLLAERLGLTSGPR